MTGLFMKRFIILASAAFFTSVAHSTIVQIEGDDLVFTYDDSTYFGTASVNGNSLFFLPTTFRVEALNTEGDQDLSVTLNIGIDVKAGSIFDIGSLQQYIAGDYFLDGSTASVSASGSLVLDSLSSANTTTLNYSTDPLNVVGELTEWDSLNTIDLADFAGWGSDSSLSLTYSNNLSASSDALGDSAFIQQKISAIGFQVIEAVEVSEPGSLALLAMGIFSLAWARKRPQ